MSDPALRLGHFGGRIVKRGSAVALERVRLDLPASNLHVDGAITGVGDVPRADLTVTSTSLAFAEIGPFVPALTNLTVRPAFTARLRGPLDALDTELKLKSSAGAASGRVLVDFGGGRRRFAGAMDLVRIDPAPWAMAPAFVGRATGHATFDLRLADRARNRPFQGTFHFKGPEAGAAGYAARDVDVQGRLDGPRLTIDRGRAVAYGARVTVAGVIEPTPGDDPGAQYSLRGHAVGVDLRRLPESIPIPDLDTRIETDYTVSGHGRDFSGKASLSDSVVEGAQLAAGTTGYFETRNRAFTYGASGRIAGLDLPRLGRALDVETLTDPRFAGTVNGTFTVDASGRSVRDLELTAKGQLADTTLLGAEMDDMAVAATISGGRLTADLRGAFTSLEPEFVSGSPTVTGVVNGRVDGRAVIRDLTDISLDDVGFDGRIDLTPSTVAGVELTSTHVVGNFLGRSGQITEATIKGPLADLTASGAFALGADGDTKLAYTIPRADLAGIAQRFDQRLAGTATLAGEVTGNGARLVTTGAGKVQQAAVAESVKAEALDLDYTVTLPDFEVAKVAIDTKVSGRGIDVAGQRIDTLAGRVGYAAKSVTFDVRGADRTRTVDAAGRADLVDGRQHVVLSKLAATVEGLVWRLRDGAEATVDYDGRQVTIAGLSLAHDAATVNARGSLAVDESATSKFDVDVEGLQIADINRLLRRPPGEYSGILQGTATIGGTRAHPEAVARFGLTQGVVRELHFAEAGGDVTWDGRFIGVDVTIIQQAGATLAARGHVPLALIQGDETARGRDPIDLHVTSSTIGLELASGLTTQLSELAGTAKIDLRVTGTADTPLFQGGVTLAGGAFTVVPTGRHYSDLTSNLRFEPGRLVIDSLRVVDENKDALEVTGELGLRRAAFGAVSLQVKGREFGVLRNDFGSADIDADLKITGELTAPRVQGELAFHTGRIEIDRVLAKLTGGAYATEPLDDVPIPGEGQRADEPATVGTITTSSGRTRTVRVGQPGQEGQPAAATVAEKASAGLFSKATLDVRVRIPDNLVLRGRDIRTSASSLGLGNINVTVGGDFRIRKDPGTPTALIGTVNTVRGTYDFRGRRFDILRDGRIQFQGTQPVDPNLDVTAQRLIQPSGIEARIRIQGTARNPTLSFSSDPPLDEADVLALIVFNRPLNSLGSNEKTTLVDVAGTTAAGFVVSPLTQSLGRVLNLDLFEVSATSEGGNPGGTLTVGQQVGERLYFKFRQQFGVQEVSQFVLEYRLSSFLRLQADAASGDGVGRANRSLTQRIERAGLDLIFYFSY
jgi:hypothetical protein